MWYGLIGRLPGSMLPVGLVIAGESMTGSYAVGGAAAAGLSLARAATSPVSGWLMDRFGQRITARLLLAIFTAASTGLIVIIRSGKATWLLIPLSVTAGLMGPYIGILTRTRWVTMVNRSDLERSQAIESVSDDISHLVGPPAVSVIAATFAVWIPLLAATLAAVVGTLGVTALPGEPQAYRLPRTRIRTPRWITPRRRPTRPPPLRFGPRMRTRGWITPQRLVFLGSLVGLGMVLSGVVITVIAYTAELGRPAWAALVFALNSAASLMMAVVVGRLGEGDLHGRYRRATLFLFLAMIPYGLVNGIAWFTLSGFIAGLAISPTFIRANSLIAATTPVERRAEAFSWLAGAVGVGLAVGSALAGRLADTVGAGQTRAWVLAFAALPAAMVFGSRLLAERTE